MHINYNDPYIWLDHRYAFDAEARNPSIEKKFIKYFSERESIHILDAGAGTGNNFKYYFEKLPNQKQSWVLLEQEAGSIEQCRKRLQRFAEKKGYELETTDDRFLLKAEGKLAQIQFEQGNLQDIKAHVDMETLDVVTANALFDLVSYEQFDHFAAQLTCYQVCLLATLNYYETSFLPFSEEDGRFVRFFHTHMMRPRDFGQGMGPNCSEEMLELLVAHEMKVEQEESRWHLKRYDTTMQHYILHFFEQAIRDLSLSDSELRDTDQWISTKKEMSQSHTLEIIVDHSDIFAYPW